MLSAYPDYPDEVSLDQIERVFLTDREMYLTGELDDRFTLQIYHAEEEQAKDDECELILIAGQRDEEGIILMSDAYSLDEIVHHFALDRGKAMWLVDKDVPRLLSPEELRAMGYSEEQIAQMLKNRAELYDD